MLKRAVESVLNQSYPRWVHVVVNDGGVASAVEAVLDLYRDQYEGRLCVIHNPISLGMEAASNLGIRAVESEYIAIHDDDDSWSPDFLSQSVSALRWWSARMPSVRGVVTHCHRVIEHVEGNVAVIDRVEPFNQWMAPGLVSLDDILHQNLFPPIAFLYERVVFEEIGGYREDLPVLGDWEFNVRFLLRHDIAVHPVTLAFYHHRPAAGGALSNTVFGGAFLHQQYKKALLNQWLREDLGAGRLGIGVYASLRQHVAYISWKVGERTSTLGSPGVGFLSALGTWWGQRNRWQLARRFLHYVRNEGIGRAMQRARLWAAVKGGQGA